MTTTTSPVERAATSPQRRLGILQYVGYAGGYAANNLAFSMTSLFLLIYYTDVVGISAAAAGTLFLVIRIWDAFADVFAGRTVDRTMTRWGKFRPFFLFGSLPLLLLSVATFTCRVWWTAAASSSCSPTSPTVRSAWRTAWSTSRSGPSPRR